MLGEDEGSLIPAATTATDVDAGRVLVVRPALTLAQRRHKYHYTTPPKPGWRAWIRGRARAWCWCSRRRVWGAVVALLPVLGWLPRYNPRKALFGDLISGATVGVMHIPQGMAYALLAGVPPVTGLYMAFFPVLVYVILGTSPHISMGTFAIGCLMMGKVVGELATNNPGIVSPTFSNVTLEILDNTTPFLLVSSTPAPHESHYTPQEVGAVLALAVGMWEVSLAVAQLGELFGLFLSDMLISGFTTGVAIHVLMTQVKYLFGLTIPRYNGPFKIFYTGRDVAAKLMSANPAAMVVSFSSILVLLITNELLKPRAKKYTKIPIPIELLAVVVGTGGSYLVNLEHNYDVRVVGDIPTGLPSPSLPPIELLPRVAVDAFFIGLVGYTTTFSMAKIFAKRQGYTVDATQELYAQGMSNMFGSFFSCGPMAASLSRSLIQEAVGGATLLTALISCVFIIIVLLFIGPLFETLPNCVLSSIILVSLKGLFMQFQDLFTLWAVSHLDALIWAITFTVCVIVDIDYGLMAGMGGSLLVLLARSQRPPTARLGHVPHTDVYLDIAKYQLAVEVAGVSIFQFGGALHFANAEYFRSKLLSVSGVDLDALKTARMELQEQPDGSHTTKQPLTPDPEETTASRGPVTNSETQETLDVELQQTPADRELPDAELHQAQGDRETMDTELQQTPADRDTTNLTSTFLTLPTVEWVVVEMSGVTYVDTTGAKMLTHLHKELRNVGITLCLAAVPERVQESLARCGTLDVITRDLLFHSTHDAVTVITHTQLHLPPMSATHL
ncbi:prestin-like [Procambarus clarkii]|uniref:prestin-like n=1 Tax=Procambarus clarkii TaxID=6728 RepID=UPI003744B1EE